jgi:hypothetical protein
MPSDWIQFCKKYASDNNIKYSDALKKCSGLYKGKTTKVEQPQPEPTPEPTPEAKPRRRRRKKEEIVEPI